MTRMDRQQEAKPDSGSAVPVVRLAGLTINYTTRRGVVPAVDGIDLDIAPGQLVALVGPSGCGKTSVLRCVAGLLPPTVGTVEIDGEPPKAALQRRDIALMTQRVALLPNRTVEQNIRLPLDIARRRDPAAVATALRLVELEQFARAYPHELSGGMQQRAALGRAYVLRPRILLLDEPFSALDEILRERFAEQFSVIQRATHQTSLLVTHSVEEAVFLADRVAVLSSRPARIVDIVEITLPFERTAALRTSLELFHLVSAVRATLRKADR